jgi:tetratricopeptide (TPR) repeat protein
MKPKKHSLRSSVHSLLRMLALAAGMLLLAPAVVAQTPAVTALLNRAHAQEQAGRVDLAAQTWQQVLLIDPKDREALLGLARWAKLEGHDSEASRYIELLHQIDPHDSKMAGEIEAVELTQSSKERSGKLQQAAQLARQGHADEALRVYRGVWGNRPPDGDWALAYYDTEASIEADRADAVAGLRALTKKYPADQRYGVTLGRILTYTPQTRAEGVHLLEQFPQDGTAQQALRQALGWDAQNPAAAAEIGAYLRQHPDAQLEHALSETEERAAAQAKLHHEDAQDAAKTAELWADVRHGTESLNANKTDEAITAYKAALALRPNTVEALNGLSGSYMKAGQPAQAIAVYQQIVKLQPKSNEAWRGLFDAQVQAGQAADALETQKRLPAAVKAAVQSDPGYLRSLAAAYRAMGQTVEAQTTLEQALALPFPNDDHHLKTETRLAYAGLLVEGKRFAQAAGLYREILYDDPESLPAWQGLIDVQHHAGHDPEAIATVERMSPAMYDAALEDSGFLAMLAGIYQQQNRFALALDLLQRAARGYTAQSRPVPLPLQLQLASIYLQQNKPELAYAIFRSVLSGRPDSAEAWKGLVAGLHQTHRDRDALAELRQLPPEVRRTLDRDVAYNQTVAGVYAATGNSAAALQLIAQIKQHYRLQHTLAPAEIDIQNVWLLYNTHDDRDLYRALMALGDRDDLRDDQRRGVQNLWATWSVRRAGEAVDAGNAKRSLEILNVAAQAFPGNAEVAKALAGGYLKAGDPKRAMTIYATLDLTNASAADYQGMVGAALAASNLHQAEQWLREALDKFANDPQVLALAARFEQARGDHARAAQYWKASLKAAPAVNPANRLAHTLDRADAQSMRGVQETGLAGLLDPDNEAGTRTQRPTLPGYRNAAGGSAPSTASVSASAALFGPDPYLVGSAPVQVGDVAKGQTETSDAFAPPDLPTNIGPNKVSQTASKTDAGSSSRAPVEGPRDPDAGGSPSNAIYLQPQSKPVLAAFLPPLFVPLDDQLREVSEGAAITLSPPEVAPQPTGISDQQLQQQNLPPLRGPWSSTQSYERAVVDEDPRDVAEQQIASIEAGYSPWYGGSGYVDHRTGTPGFDELYILEAPYESSKTVGGSARLTAIVMPSFLDSRLSTGTSTTYQLGTLAATATPLQQNASGVGGEGQLTTSNFGLSIGTTPRGFLVPNIIGRFELHPASKPFKLSFVRDAVKDSQLSYAGLNDPGSASSSYAGNAWGGVVSNAMELQYGRSDQFSGYYVGVGGQYLTGLNVLTNKRYDGVAGAYWKLLNIPKTAELTLGANFFGMHYDHNLRYFSYGQGGYFSPNVYFLANLPLSMKGQYGANLHYAISAALGLQAFQEDSSLYYPLEPASSSASLPLHRPAASPALPGSTPSLYNGSYPGQSVVGGNYDLHAEFAEHVVDRWYVGGFVNLNNTRDYASQTVGFFLRYVGRPASNDEAAPTGIFPYTGQRPLMVP